MVNDILGKKSEARTLAFLRILSSMMKSTASTNFLPYRLFRDVGVIFFLVIAGVIASVAFFYFARWDIQTFFQHHTEMNPKVIMLISELLPYGGLFFGLFLTWTIVFYLFTVKRRNEKVTQLALSLSQANEELNQRIADEARMARALQASEQRYRDLFENTGIGICQIAPTGEWLKANRAVAQILGYDNPQELLTDQPDFNSKLFIDAEQRSKWFSGLRNGSQRDYQTELFTRDHHRIWVSMSGYATQENGRSFFECTLFDITERRRGELALMTAKEQADFANRSKSEFLANMSHELRTPLNAIIGFAEIIKGEMFGPAGQAQYVEYARDIYDSGELLLSLINDILDMSKIEAGKRTLSETVLNIERVVDSVIRLVAARAKTGKLHLHLNVAKDLPALRGEEKAMKQILTNLLTNAIKFTPEGGDVTLTAALDEQRRIFIRVEDTGIGIATEDVVVALAPFGQIESVLSRKNQGTGLGLPMTVALAELHGGILDLKSTVGTGTAITITFPVDRVVQSLVEA